MKSTNPQTVQGTRRIDLDSQYRAIGIPAVAAAVQYKGETKTTAAASEPAKQEVKWLADIAA